MTSYAEELGWDAEKFFPMAAAPVDGYKTSPRDALVNIIVKALRSEAGVRRKQDEKQPTAYYAGRRTGFICSAAVLMEQLYSVDYEEAKSALGKAVRKTGETWVVVDLIDPEKNGKRADEIVTAVLDGRMVP